MESFKREKARLFALSHHGEQVGRTYGEIEPYFSHLERVVRLVGMMNKTEKAEVVAWLHDTVEDTNTSLAEISENFGEDVAKCVDVLSNRDGENYFDYIQRIIDSQDETAIWVKRADLIENLSRCYAKEYRSKAGRYLRAIEMLMPSESSRLEIVRGVNTIAV